MNGFVIDILRVNCKGDIFSYYSNKMITFINQIEQYMDESNKIISENAP